SVRSMSCLSAGIDKVSGGGPETHDDAHRGTTGRTAGRVRWQGRARWELHIAGVSLHDQEADSRKRDGTAGMKKAEVADFLKAIGQDMLEEPADKLDDVQVCGAEACTAHFPVGERDRVVLEADDALVGDGDLEDIGGKVGEGGMAVVMG